MVERPLRLRSQFTRKAVESLRFASGDEEIRRRLYAEFGQAINDDFHRIKKDMEAALKGNNGENGEEGEDEGAQARTSIPEKRRKKLLDASTWERDLRIHEAARGLWKKFGDKLYEDHNKFREDFGGAVERLGLKLSASDRKVILNAVSWLDDEAPPVIAKVYKGRKAETDPLHGRFEVALDGQSCVVEYEPDSDLRDTEQVPLLEEGGIEAFFRREVLPYVPDAWIEEGATKIGYEISFTRYFYKPKPLRSLDEIRADIEVVQKESEGLLQSILEES